MPRCYRPHVLGVDDGPFDKGVSRTVPLVGVTMEGPDLVEAPDDEALAKFSMAVGAQGNVQLESLRAFDEKQYKSLISNLP